MNKIKKYLIFQLGIILILLSIFIGRYSISLRDLYFLNDKTIAIFFNLRLPRIIAALLVGGALSTAGASYQGMFRNPLVSPDILGASAGASFGVAVGILLSLNVQFIQVFAFIFGLIAVISSWRISKRIPHHDPSLVLVLSGMLVQGIFTSGVSLVKYICDPYDKLPAITFWLMGGLSSITLNDLQVMVIPIILGLLPLLLIRWKLNILSFPEEEAKTLGVNTDRIRIIVIICSTLLSASIVSYCGIIGWVGLVIPHLTRSLYGPNYKILLPTSFIIGGLYMLLVDDLARCVFPVEVPLGILTSLIGIPFFAYLLINVRKGWI
ncbi:iron ABC transporter permease [Clostridium sporogenes]|uniref:Iron ABC transporter permease n=1 Tax=Clostridium sporogenes TaxID=1509 RepID=A0AAE4FLE2_CLOSG|nr:iron ABC transporter permease [Clostridium sporogenes]MDS1003567.1 iron ABC transporter permease [Clostridium sporogenes]